MTLKTNLRLTYDENDGMVTMRLRRRPRPGRRGNFIPFSRVRRSELRELCDLLHDLADDLDRKDREA